MGRAKVDSRSRRADTRVTAWAPPDPENVAEQDAYGAVDRSADNWTRKGTYWVSIVAQSASDSPIGGQASSSQTHLVEIERRDDWSLDWRLEILDGPYSGRFLYPTSVSFDNARSREMILVCTLARKT